MDVFCIDSVNIDSIECIRDPCAVLTVLTYIVYIAMLLYIVYGILFVNTVDTKITGSYSTAYTEYYEV